jgi:predicted nucleotidyltransferase
MKTLEEIKQRLGQHKSLLQERYLENYLSDNLGVQVDWVHKSGLKPRIGDRLLAEVVYL